MVSFIRPLSFNLNKIAFVLCGVRFAVFVIIIEAKNKVFE